MEKNDLILGLDVSTKTIGIALFEDMGDYGELLRLSHFSPKAKPKPSSKIEELVKKVEDFEEKIIKNFINIGITKVIIEEPLLRSNNINTVGTLLKFNGMISNTVYRKLGIIPEFISSYDARAYGFPELLEVRKYKKDGTPYSESSLKNKKPTLFGGYPTDIDKKQIIWEKVNDIETKPIKWPKNRKGNLAKECFDMTDSYVCVLGHMNKIGKWPKSNVD